MTLLETDTLSNQNISSALAIGSYTVATGIEFVMCSVFADQIAGNATYTIYLVHQLAGAGSSYKAYDLTASAVASGDTAACWYSGIIPVDATDVLTVYLDGAAGDTTTPDTIIKWRNVAPLQPTVAGRTADVTATGGVGIDWANVEAPTTTLVLSGTTVGTATTIGATGAGVVADAVWDEATSGHVTAGTFGKFLADLIAAIWAYVTRTLTQAAASVTSTVTGSEISIQRGDTLSAALTGLASNTGYVSIDFTVKRDKADLDTAAILCIRKNASGSGDGLLYLNGAAPVSPVVAADGSITVVSSTALTIALAARASDDLVPADGLYYDIQLITASAVTTISEGTCNILADVRRAIA